MKFQIRKTLLIKALGFAYEPVFTGSGESLPDYVKNVRIVVTKNSIVFSGTNLDILFVYSINQSDDNLIIDSPGKCLVYVKSLFTILRKLKGDDLIDCELFVEEEDKHDSLSKFIVRYKSTVQELPCQLKFDYPADALKIKDVTNAIKYPIKDFFDSYAKIAFACGQNFYRYELKNFAVDFIDDKVYFVGSSGLNVAIFESPLKIPNQPTEQLLLRKDAIPLDKKNYNEDGDIAISFGVNKRGNQILYINHDLGDSFFEIYARPIDKPYPNWRVFQDPSNDRSEFAVFDKKELIDVIDRIQSVSPMVINLYTESSTSVRFGGGSTDKYNCDIYETMDAEVSNVGKSLYINTVLLRDGVKNIKAEKIHVQLVMIGSNEILRITGDDGSDGFTYFLNTLQQSEDNGSS